MLACSWDRPSHPLKVIARAALLGTRRVPGEESVLAGSGREGEITARVGRVDTCGLFEHSAGGKE